MATDTLTLIFTLCCFPGCNALTPDRYCGAHLHGYDQMRPSSAERGYSGKAWENKRRLALHRDPWCRACNVHPSQHVDHVKPKAQGGSDELSNLQGLCASCHSKKTLAERRGEGGIESLEASAS